MTDSKETTNLTDTNDEKRVMNSNNGLEQNEPIEGDMDNLDDQETILKPDAPASEDDKTVMSEPTQSTKTTNIDESLPSAGELSTPYVDSDQTQIAPGAVLRNRFDLLEVIGQGGMGKVYKALDKRDVEAGNTKFIAIKIINDEFKSDNNLLKALHAETRKTQSLAHPNIVTVYDFDRDEGTVFMTMEYIEGIPLSDMIKAETKGLTVDAAIKMVAQIGNALVYAHSQHIIHLDLKPSNIFVDASKRIKVFDFGISRVSNIFQVKGFDVGTLGGLTPSYASLEMFNGADPDPRDDIYALACITYELLTGKHPYNRERADVLQGKNFKPKKVEGLSSEQWSTLLQALAIRREDRIQSVELFLQGMTVKATTTVSKNSGVMVVGVGLLLGVSALGYYLYSQYGNPLDQEIVPVTVVKKQVEPATVVDNEAKQQPEPIIEPIIFPVAKKPLEKPVIQVRKDIILGTNKQIFKIGEVVTFEFMVTAPMYVLFAVINSKNELTLLFPNPFQSDTYCVAGLKYQIPPKGADFDVYIEGPIGIDHIFAVMSDKPIAKDFLDNLNDLDKMKARVTNAGLTYAVKEYQIVK